MENLKEPRPVGRALDNVYLRAQNASLQPAHLEYGNLALADCHVCHFIYFSELCRVGTLNYIHEFHIQHGNFEMGVCKNSCGAKYVATLQFNKY